MSLFSSIELAQRDPILGLNEIYNTDAKLSKVNLGIGVYQDNNGKLPLLSCVREAETMVFESAKSHGYLGIDGLPSYTTAVKGLLFGALSEPVTSNRVVTVQAIGGTGALKLGADFLKKLVNPSARVYISDPSWENHRALFTSAGFTVDTYPYYDAKKLGLDFESMLKTLSSADKGSIILLHACCHNPTGYDISEQQWSEVIKICQNKQLIPFLDMAYQGFKDGLEEDRSVLTQFSQSGLSFLVASSFSKNFSLYGERVGALSLVCENKDESTRVLSQIKVVIRTNYSNPPSHGASLVASILTNAERYTYWKSEVQEMRERIQLMRKKLVEGLAVAGIQKDMSFITQQVGMFSYSGLNITQMQRLRNEFSIYGTDTGRLNIAALNTNNIDYVCKAISCIMQS
jgi:aromatic-amino-acid transaminase